MKTDNILQVKTLGNGNVAFVTKRGIVEINKMSGNMTFYGELPKGHTGTGRTFYCSGGYRNMVQDIRNYAK